MPDSVERGAFTRPEEISVPEESIGSAEGEKTSLVYDATTIINKRHDRLASEDF